MVNLDVLLSFVASIITAALAGIALSLFALLLKSRSKERKELMNLISESRVNQKSIKAEIESVLETEGGDEKSTFLILMIDVERRLRQFASSFFERKRPLPIQQIVKQLIEQEALGNEWEKSFRVLWRIRSNLVHGLSVTDAEIELGTRLAGSLIVDLKRKEDKLGVKLPQATLEIYQDREGKFRWRFIAPNGQILITSEAYDSKANCKNGIEMFRRNFPKATIRDLTEH